MRAVIDSLPSSELRQEYDHIYSTIYNRLNGSTLFGSLKRVDTSSNPGNLIRRSHELANEILNWSMEDLSEAEPAKSLRRLLFDRRAFIETESYDLRHHLLLQGTCYSMYFFPAVRLSLVAAAKSVGHRNDPCGELMKERSDTARLIRNYSYLFH